MAWGKELAKDHSCSRALFAARTDEVTSLPSFGDEWYALQPSSDAPGALNNLLAMSVFCSRDFDGVEVRPPSVETGVPYRRDSRWTPKITTSGSERIPGASQVAPLPYSKSF